MREVVIDGQSLTLEEAVAISNGSARAILSEDARVAMLISRNAIEQILLSDQVVYGINTGFGAMSSVRIDGDDLEDLQKHHESDLKEVRKELNEIALAMPEKYVA